MFIRYPHLEKYGTTEVADIDFGVCHIFPKLDGTNSSVWIENGIIKAGSRNRQLDTVSYEKDNAGFASWAVQQDNIKNFLVKYPNLRLYGEWLVPHTIKEYREDAWKKFYVFDVWCQEIESFIPYDKYKEFLNLYKIDFIPCTKIIKNPSYDNFVYEAKNNFFLMKDGFVGEGIVIKNYNWKNKYNRVVWAKIINQEFKDKHLSIFNSPIVENRSNAEIIAEKACTEHLVRKEYAKLINEQGEFPKALIPRLLHTVYYSVVKEELWDCLKDIKRGNVNFRELEQFCIQRTKQFVPEVFGK